MKIRVHKCTVELRYEAWDKGSDHGVVAGKLSNEFVIVCENLPKLFVELLAMSVGDEELGCTSGELTLSMDLEIQVLFGQYHMERQKL
jgi:hypothetical protein